MIKLFVKTSPGTKIRMRFYCDKLTGTNSHSREVTSSMGLRNLQKERDFYSSQYMGINTRKVDSTHLKAQVHKKGVDQKLIKYMLEPDDNYLDALVGMHS